MIGFWRILTDRSFGGYKIWTDYYYSLTIKPIEHWFYFHTTQIYTVGKKIVIKSYIKKKLALAKS
jgi:hypothetical protein